MTDWEWKRDHVKDGKNFFAKASELHGLKQRMEWEVDAEGWWRVALREVGDRHPEDLAKIEPVGMLTPILMPEGNPLYREPSPINLTIGSTSEDSPANTALNRLAARIPSLDKLDWPKPEALGHAGLSIKRFPSWKATEKAYAERVVSAREETGRTPTLEADCAWGSEHGLMRERVRGLRRNSPDRTDKDRRRPNLAKN